MRIFEIFEDKKYPPHQEELLRKAAEAEKEGKWDPVNRVFVDPKNRPKFKHVMTDVTPKGYGPIEESSYIDLRDYPSKKNMGLEGPMRHPKNKEVIVYLDPKTGKYYKAPSPENRMKENSSGSNGTFPPGLDPKFSDYYEDYKILPDFDRDEYPDKSKEGLEGPFRLNSGLVVYYDPREGKYYDSKSDIYLSHEEYEQHNLNESEQLNENMVTVSNVINDYVNSTDDDGISDVVIIALGSVIRELERRILSSNYNREDLNKQREATNSARAVFDRIRNSS